MVIIKKSVLSASTNHWCFNIRIISSNISYINIRTYIKIKKLRSNMLQIKFKFCNACRRPQASDL